MKLKIKVKYLNPECKINIIPQGDWVDLRTSEAVMMKAPQSNTLKKRKVDNKEEGYRNVSFDYKVIKLGIAMQLPKGFEAIVVARSSTFKEYGVSVPNGFGVIDNTYCGNDDEWRFPAIAYRDTFIPTATRICQFRIQLSQKATMWQKIKWLFTSGIKFEEVKEFNNENRGGIGSTGRI